jgi:uracil-DNA glycosylase family 4
MDDIFKQNLLSLRNPPAPTTFAEALLKPGNWKLKVEEKLSMRSLHLSDSFTEKKQVLESLERFAEEKVQDLSSPVFSVPGGEIHLRQPPVWDGIKSVQSLDELKGSLSLGDEFLSVLLRAKNPQVVKVIFVTESLRSWSEAASDFKGGFLDELLTGFPLKTAELFGRMIAAMKLTPEEILLYPVDLQGKDLSEEVIACAAYFGPEVIVTLGARATQKILKNNDRLSLIHGQFFSREVKGIGLFPIVPLFHPSIIETNQNMKKTAWADMQKIMVALKKLA